MKEGEIPKFSLWRKQPVREFTRFCYSLAYCDFVFGHTN